MRGAMLVVRSSDRPKLKKDEYFSNDLIGMRAITYAAGAAQSSLIKDIGKRDKDEEVAQSSDTVAAGLGQGNDATTMTENEESTEVNDTLEDDDTTQEAQYLGRIVDVQSVGPTELLEVHRSYE